MAEIKFTKEYISSMVGKKYGSLTFISFHRSKCKWKVLKCLCVCDCGKTVTPLIYAVENGKVVRCGSCTRVIKNKENGKGVTKLPEYKIWIGIISRCENNKTKDYHHYGGRGITISKEWRHDFKLFLNDMGNRPTPKHSIDRIDVNGNYEKSNCKWATQSEQRNNTRSSIFIEFNGIKKTAYYWSLETGLKATTISERYRKGWPVEKVLCNKLFINNKK